MCPTVLGCASQSSSELDSAEACTRSFGTAEIAGVATGVSQARPRLRLGRGVSKLPLCARLARGFSPCAVVLPQAVFEEGLIEVIADDERLKRHTLKLCVDCTARANFSESDGQCRYAVEPVERRADCDGNCCICASGQPEMGASASLLLRHIYDCTSTTCS